MHSPSRVHAWPKIPPDVYQQQYPGALPLESEVYCWFDARHCWFSATIIYARLLKTETARIRESITPIVKRSFSWTKGVDNYEYYVHFHGEDRRQDFWCPASLLRPKNFTFDEAEPHSMVAPGPDEIHKSMDADYLREHEESTKLKTIVQIYLDNYLIDTWYFSPYPKEFHDVDILYICKFCLDYFKAQTELAQHMQLCSVKHPPGMEIYRHPPRDNTSDTSQVNLSVFEVDGTSGRRFAENLCLLSKLFLDHKTLRHPVYLFLFYVLTEYQHGEYRVVAYFSKEKYSKNNLSCIMCLPQHQRKGYGQLLINLSYALSYRERKRGTPERPLSDLGKATYYKYWGQVALHALFKSNQEDAISLEDIAQQTAVAVEDIVLAFQSQGILRFFQKPYTAPDLTNPTPYFFVPHKFENAAAEWARPAFSTDNLVSKVRAMVAKAKAEEEEEKQPQQSGHSAKRASVASSLGSAAKMQNPPKRRRSMGAHHQRKQQHLQMPAAEGPPSSKAVAQLEPINPANLFWESYERHMGPFEFAPTENAFKLF